MGIIPKHILSGQDLNTTPFNKQTPIGTPIQDDPKWTNDMWEYCSKPHALLCLEQ